MHHVICQEKQQRRGKSMKNDFFHCINKKEKGKCYKTSPPSLMHFNVIVYCSLESTSTDYFQEYVKT